MDLATAKGMDLAVAADLIGKSVASSTNALSRYGIEIDKSTSKTEQAETVISEINRQFGGAASADINEYSGRTRLLGQNWGDFTEQVGAFITQSPNLGGALVGINALLETMVAHLKEINKNEKLIDLDLDIGRPEVAAFIADLKKLRKQLKEGDISFGVYTLELKELNETYSSVVINTGKLALKQEELRKGIEASTKAAEEQNKVMQSGGGGRTGIGPLSDDEQFPELSGFADEQAPEMLDASAIAMRNLNEGLAANTKLMKANREQVEKDLEIVREKYEKVFRATDAFFNGLNNALLNNGKVFKEAVKALVASVVTTIVSLVAEWVKVKILTAAYKKLGAAKVAAGEGGGSNAGAAIGTAVGGPLGGVVGNIVFGGLGIFDDPVNDAMLRRENRRIARFSAEGIAEGMNEVANRTGNSMSNGASVSMGDININVRGNANSETVNQIIELLIDELPQMIIDGRVEVPTTVKRSAR